MKETPDKTNEPTTLTRPNPWKLRVVVILFIWLLIYFFVAGPGRLLFPSLLITYTSVSDHQNTVYFHGNRIEKAMDLLWLAAITQDSIEQFWGDSTGNEFRHGITIFLCESPQQYFHLTWNHATGSATMGRMVLNASRIEGNMPLYSAMVHEMYHLYIKRKFGYIPSVLFYPKWFEEGCATMLQDYSVDADNLDENLWSWPTMVTVTSLEHPWNWQSMMRMENGKMVAKGYGQVCLFTRYLSERYGKEKMRKYQSGLSWNLEPDRAFEQAFEIPLEEAESEWLQSMVETKEAPAEASFISLPFDFMIFLKWLLIITVIIFPVVLLIYWIFRIVSRRRRRNIS